MKSNVDTNPEGLTLEEWMYAAAPGSVLVKAWRAGEDPAEWRSSAPSSLFTAETLTALQAEPWLVVLLTPDQVCEIARIARSAL